MEGIAKQGSNEPKAGSQKASRSARRRSRAASVAARLARLLDYFVAPGEDADDDERRRGLILVGSSLVVILFAVPLAVVDVVHEGRAGPTVWVFLLTLPPLLANPWLLRWTRSVTVIGVLTAFELLIALTLLTYFNGGLDSASLMWTAILPLLVGLWTGPRTALAFAALVAVEVGLFYHLDTLGYTFPRPLTPLQMRWWRFAGLGSVTLFATLIVCVYEAYTLQALRRRARALLRSRSLFESMIDNALDAVVMIDAQGRIIQWSRRASQLFGWSQAEAVGSHAAEKLLAPRGPGRTESRRRSLFRSGEHRVLVALNERLELTGLHRDGLRFPMEVSISPPVEVGDSTYNTLFVRDLSEQRLHSEAIKRLQRDFRQVIERHPDGVAVCRAGRIVYANPTWAAWLGHAPDELIGTPLEKLLCDDGRSPAPREAALRLERHGLKGQELRFSKRDGGEVSLELSSVPGIEFEGAEASVIVGRDVTERKAIQTQLFLTERMAAMGALAAAMAHEINNPLTYIVANLEHLRRQSATEGAAGVALAEVLEECQEGARRVARIVSDLKRFSRAEDDESAPVRAADVVRTALKLTGNQISHSTQLTVETDESLWVEANEAQLTQVLVNLLVNALQALDDPGAAGDSIELRCLRAPDGRVSFEVQDAGPGIRPENRKRIFDHFFTTKPVGVGTGLGLSICHDIVSRLHGEIEVESDGRAGSTFRVLLPATESPTAGVWQPVEEALSELPRRVRVVVIDDEPLVLRSLARTLQDFEVRTFSDGTAAIEHLVRESFVDVVLCDVMMVGVSGIDVYESVRQLRPEVAERFVFMTGGVFTDRARSFLKDVPNRLLPKPLDVKQLTGLVREAEGVSNPRA